MMDVMIDLETLGRNPGCMVVSLGAVVFNPNKGVDAKKTCHIVFDLEDQAREGLHMDVSTVRWWLKQELPARRLFEGSGVALRSGLDTFDRWFKGLKCPTKDTYVWGNGSSFDISILEALYHKIGAKPPWAYNRVMDLRTFKRFTGKGKQVPRAKGIHHNALDDAFNQAEYVVNIIKEQTDE